MCELEVNGYLLASPHIIVRFKLLLVYSKPSLIRAECKPASFPDQGSILQQTRDARPLTLSNLRRFLVQVKRLHHLSLEGLGARLRFSSYVLDICVIQREGAAL